MIMKETKRIIAKYKELREVIRVARKKMEKLRRRFYDAFIQECSEKDYFDVVFGREILENINGTLAEKWGVEPNKHSKIGKDGPEITIICATENPLVTIPRDAGLNKIYVCGVSELRDGKTSILGTGLDPSNKLKQLYEKYGLNIEVVFLPIGTTSLPQAHPLYKATLEILKKSEKGLIKFIGFCSDCYEIEFGIMSEVAQNLSKKGKIIEFYDFTGPTKIYTPVGSFEISKKDSK